VAGRQTAATGPFAAGATVVRRDIHAARVWSAQPHRAISDTGTVLTLGYWPGIRSFAPTTWTAALRTDTAIRKSGLANLAAGTWMLGSWAWRDTVVRSRFEAGEMFSLHYFQAPVTGEPLRLYVNFERPAVRARIGIDTLDLLVDLVVDPDLSGYAFKDEDEYAHGRRLGFITDDDHRLIEQARMRALGVTHTTFYRNYPEPIAWFKSQLADRHRSVAAPTDSARADGETARLRRENSDLRKLVRIYAEAIRRLTVDKAALEDDLQALSGVTSLTERRRGHDGGVGPCCDSLNPYHSSFWVSVSEAVRAPAGC
jgi:hypothetical protein